MIYFKAGNRLCYYDPERERIYRVGLGWGAITWTNYEVNKMINSGFWQELTEVEALAAVLMS